MKYHNKGFSIIEILVAVAIIGMLSSVVMASIRIARNSGANSGIKENLHNVRIEAQNYFDSNGGFGTASTDCVTIGSMFTDSAISRQIGQATSSSGQQAVCANSAMLWVVSVPLLGGGSWCVDETSVAKEAVADTVAMACP